MALLGNTLTAIAGEKAGIIKPHVPVIIGELLPETVPVFEQKALLEKAPLYKAVEYYTIANWQYEHHLLTATVTTATGNTTYSIDLPGLYQLCNLPAVLKAVALLSKMGFSITTETVQQALQQVKKLTGLHGRWEIIAENPPVILDVGHNEDGVKVILQQLQHTTYENLHIVLGMVKDKAIDKILALLPKTATYYFTAVQIPRALPANLLQEQAAACELKGNTYTNVNEALAAAKNAAAYADLILVCGSVFLVGEVER
jgi:dihydrofolate synthase / folylpolyglutamate synthase